MSLFKERQASAKKLIQLQNEVLALKAKLQNSQQAPPEDCQKCLQSDKDLEEFLLQTESLNSEISELRISVSSLLSSIVGVSSISSSSSIGLMLNVSSSFFVMSKISLHLRYTFDLIHMFYKFLLTHLIYLV